MNISIEEAIAALIINGAAAVGKAHEIGSIDIGKKGDILILEFPSYKFIPYHIGVSTVEKVIKNLYIKAIYICYQKMMIKAFVIPKK